MSIEWASSGVRVNAVAPGIIFSPTAKANYTENIFEAVLPYLPAKRFGTPQEVRTTLHEPKPFVQDTFIKCLVCMD